MDQSGQISGTNEGKDPVSTPISYTAKILLFGEYLVLQGAPGLAIPYSRFSGAWQYSYKPASGELRAFYDYIIHTPGLKNEFDTGSMLKDLDKGLVFKSDIPQGAGLGSSGALCAAVYDRYGLHAENRTDCTGNKEASGQKLFKVKQLFALIEAHFHGESSGLDPLVSWLNEPLMLNSPVAGQLQLTSMSHSPNRLFLFDTGIARQTGPLVRGFLDRAAQPSFDSAIQQMNSANVQAIEAFLGGNKDALRKAFDELSALQLQHMRPMIPEDIVKQWEMGLESGAYSLKLCGAGGGGFMLGIGDGQTLGRIFLI